MKDEILQNPSKRVVVFVSKKVNVKDVVLSLRKKGFAVASMHSDLEQKDREDTMNAFKAGRVNVLVATDIVSRGIDITGIELVINFDMPHDPEDYVHRIGRTARADRDGESLTMVNCNDGRELRKFRDLERFIEKQMERIPVPEDLGGCDGRPLKEERRERSRRQPRKDSHKDIQNTNNNTQDEQTYKKHRRSDRRHDRRGNKSAGSTSSAQASDNPTA